VWHWISTVTEEYGPNAKDSPAMSTKW
jgi:hypothetical protein